MSNSIAKLNTATHWDDVPWGLHPEMHGGGPAQNGHVTSIYCERAAKTAVIRALAQAGVKCHDAAVCRAMHGRCLCDACV